MKRTVKEIAAFVGGQLQGNGDIQIESVANLDAAGPADLSYADENFSVQASTSRAGCLLVKSGEFPGRTVIVVVNPKLAFAKAAGLLLGTERHETEIHPTAVIEPGAAIGKGARIGAGCYVGKGSSIGGGTVLHPRVVVYSNVKIGENVIIHSGAVIGADGFGFVRDGNIQVKFPQIGGVIIEDDVEIGANTCVDSGALGTTIIRKGAKLDNLIQIAHNVEIGENTVIAAQAGISGSCSVGAQSMIGGQVGIGEHAQLEAGTAIGGQGGILAGKRVRGGEVLFGTPARPLKEFLEQQAALGRLPGILRTIRRKLGI